MAQGSLPNQQDMEVDLRRQLNDVFGEFEDFAGLVGRQIFGVIPTSGVMRGLNPYSPNRIPSNIALPSASLCLQEMKNVPPLIPPLQVTRNEIENSGCASEASSSHSHMNDDENYNGRKKRKRNDNEDEGEGPNKRKEKKEENKMMRDLFDDDNEDEKGEWRERSNNVPRQGIRRMIMNMQVEPLIPPIDVEGRQKKKEEEEERDERERRRRKEKEEMERRRKEKYDEEERKRKKDEEEERRRKREEEEERKRKKDDEEKRKRKEDEEKRRKREDEDKEREKKRKEAEEKRKRKEDLEREEEERRIRKERKRLEKEERRKREEEERMKEEEIERKKNEEEQEKRRLEEVRLEKEIREREELARKMEEEKKRDAERMRLEEERRKEMEGMRKEEEARRKEVEASKKREDDERKKKEEEDTRMRRERKKEEDKKRQKTDEKDRKKKVDLNLGNREKEKKGSLPLNTISLSKLEVLKEKEKDKRKREKMSESKEGKSGSLINEKKKKEWKEEKGKDKKVKDLEKLAKKEVSSGRSSPMSSKNSSRVATPIPPLSLPSTSSHHGVTSVGSSDVSFSYPDCLPSCRAADLVPLSPPALEQRSDIEGYTNYAKERKHRGDASQDRVLRFLHYMESGVYFALSVSFYHPAKSNDRDLSMAGCVLKDTVDLIKHGLVLIEKEGNPHLMNRAKILCFRAQSVLNYHMYFVRSNKFPRRAEALASLESQVQEVPRESPKKEENGGKKSGDKSSTPSHSSSSSNSSNMVTMPMSLWKMKSSQVSTYSHLEWSHMLWNDSIKLMTVHEKLYWNTIDNLILQSFDWGCPLHVGSSLLHLAHFINTAVSWMRLEYEAERQ